MWDARLQATRRLTREHGACAESATSKLFDYAHFG